MYVSVKFTDRACRSIAIPSRAVFQSGDTSFVFANSGNNTYRRKMVKCGGTDGDVIFIKSGLVKGEEIVVDGAYYLIEAK
jgi:cobalt-zinc-cadmium efflux system membrane fusion protein